MAQLRIAFDARWLLQPHNHPHAALFKTLLRANVRSAYPAHFLLYTDVEPPAHEWSAQPNVEVKVVPSTAPAVRGLADFWWQTRNAAPAARNARVDLFVSPFYKVPWVPLVPVVNMIHDTSVFRVPEEMIGDKYDRAWRRKVLWGLLRSSCAVSRRTVTVSNHSRRCLIEDLGLPPERVSVCYHGVEALADGEKSRARLDLLKRGPLPNAYTLFVGANIVKKNVSGLLRAWASVPLHLRAKHPLLLKTYGEEGIRRTAAELGIGESVHVLHSQLEDSQMKALFNAAHLLVLPSYDEGFGLPVAEAMIEGVPVVVARGSALEEVGGSSAVIVDPASADDIARGIVAALSWSESEHRARQEAARRNAQRFTMRAAADAFFETLSATALGTAPPVLR